MTLWNPTSFYRKFALFFAAFFLSFGFAGIFEAVYAWVVFDDNEGEFLTFGLWMTT